MIEVKNLSFSIGNKNILKNISFKINENKITGIIGKNGSGKTTLIRHFSKEIKCKNSIFINGLPLENIKRKKFSKIFSFVFQDFENVETFTVNEIIKMGRYPHKKLFMDYSKNDEMIINNIIDTFNLKKISQKKANCVSGGELKLSFIARCLVQETPIIVLDEPINHLDINYQIQLMEFLRKLKNKTIILTIHNIEMALKYCDDIIILKDGEILDYGNCKNILNSKNISSAFEVSAEIIKIKDDHLILFK